MTLEKPEMTIRTATMEDLPSLLAIYNESVRGSAATFDLEEQTLAERSVWFQQHADAYPLIVAEVSGEAVGYACLSRYREKPAYARTVECSVYIHHAFHGQGIGRRLMTALVQMAKNRDYHSVIAGITAGNEASARLHLSLGFQHIGCVREAGMKFGTWHDVHYYQLMLEG